MNALLTALPPEWTMFVLLIASFANALLIIYGTNSAFFGYKRTALAQFMIHTAITTLILWAAFGVGFLA